MADGAPKAGLKAGADLRDEKISHKVREGLAGKVPAILAVDAGLVAAGTGAIRRRAADGRPIPPFAEAVAALVGATTPPDLNRA